MGKLLLIVLLFIIFSFESKKQSAQEIKETKVDTLFYKYKGFNNGFNLYLFSNNKFEYMYYSFGCTGGGESEYITGNYQLLGDKLHLDPDSVRMRIYELNNHSDFKEYNLKYKNDSLKIKTEYDIIKWNNIQYLISPQKNHNFRTHTEVSITDYDIDSIMLKRNDYYEFADYYNLGYEPKKHGRYLIRATQKPNSTFEELEIDKLPKEWRNLFLEEPISAKITNVVKDKRTTKYNEDYTQEYFIYILTLDKGSEDHVRIGMVFYDETNKKYIKIISVSKSESKGVTYKNLEEGELIKTNWK